MPARPQWGAVYSLKHKNIVIGVVSENLEVSTFRDSYEEVDEDGVKIVTNNMRITRYGVAVNLSQLGAWFVEHTP